MNAKQRIATALTALTFATVGLTTTPADAAATQCFRHAVTVQGTGANETFHIYSDRVEIYGGLLPRTIKRSINPRETNTLHRAPFVIDTGTGNDIITARDDVGFIACFGDSASDRTDRVYKKGGKATAEFAGDGEFTATGGDNDIRINGLGTVVTGGGDDSVYIQGSGNVSSGAGNDDIFIDEFGWVEAGPGDDYIEVTVEGTVDAGSGNDEVFIQGPGRVQGGKGDDYVFIIGDGTVHAGAGDDRVYIFGQGTVDAGAGNDIIVTKEHDDSIITGAGADRVRAGKGHDNCDATRQNHSSRGDTYQGCETIYGM